jgi:hypothetical protein
MTEAIFGGEWTYSGDPAASARDAVRFWMQDIDASLPLMSDAEVDFLLSRYQAEIGSELYVAAVACEVLAAKMARQVSVSADGVSVSTGDLFSRYNELAVSLRDQYKQNRSLDSTPLVGGVMVGEARDATIKPLIFGTGFMDNINAGRQDYGDYHPGEGPYYEGIWGEEAGAPGESTP